MHMAMPMYMASGIWEGRQNPYQLFCPVSEIGTKKPDPATTTKKDCGSCYGAENEHRKCCETCDDVRKAYSEKGWALHDLERIEQCKGESWAKKWEEYEDEGCQIHGTVEVAKVSLKAR